MERVRLSKEEASKLIQQDEDHFFDHKALAISGRGVQKITTAFANSDGGDLIIGIKDSKEEPDTSKRWDGAARVEEFNGHLQALAEVQPAVNFEYTVLEADEYNGFALRVRVEKGHAVHKTADNSVYVRVGASCQKVTDPQRIQELGFAKGAVSFEDQILPESVPEDVVDSNEIGRFLESYSPKTEPLDFAVGQNLLDRKTWQPRVAGVLLFNANPSAVMPRKCAVKVARYETKEDEPEREHLADIITIEGPLYEQIKRSIAAVTDIMSSIKIWTAKGLDTVEYPPEAIWEIVVNAVIHRDYSISDDVQIQVYDNRIEVISPGKLPSFVSKENILDVRYSRNSKIVRTLARYPDPPNKDLGEGLNTAFQRMKDFRLKEPEIFEEGNYVKVILPHIPLARPAELILEFLQSHDTITNKQCRDLTGLKTESLVKIEFYKLRDEGLLEMVPGLKGPASAWQLTEEAMELKKSGMLSL